MAQYTCSGVQSVLFRAFSRILETSYTNTRMVPYLMQNHVKVLVVDDSPTLCLLMTRALQNAGYHVITASNGNDGLLKILHERPLCVVLDVVLPGMSGFGLCRQIRALDPQRRVSIIMVSTKNTPLDHSWGLRQGADRYLAKPFTDETLVQMVEEVMQSHALH